MEKNKIILEAEGHLIDKGAREHISSVEIQVGNINKRTKIHTLDIRNLNKKIKKLQKEVEKFYKEKKE